jgi:hypothetical protein
MWWVHVIHSQGVPVVRVRYGAFGKAVDELHDYVLSAITTAMSWAVERPPAGGDVLQE